MRVDQRRLKARAEEEATAQGPAIGQKQIKIISKKHE